MATGVRDVDGDLLSVSLADASVVSGALTFDTAPTVLLEVSNERVVLSGGIASADTKRRMDGNGIVNGRCVNAEHLGDIRCGNRDSGTGTVVVPNDSADIHRGSRLACRGDRDRRIGGYPRDSQWQRV